MEMFKNAAMAGQEVRRLGQVGPEAQKDPWLEELSKTAVGGMEVIGQPEVAQPRRGITPPAEGAQAEPGVIERYLSGAQEEESEVLKAYLGEAATAQQPEQPQSEGTFMGDVVRSLGRAGISMGDGVYGLANMVSFGGLDTATKSVFGTSGTEAMAAGRKALNTADSAELQRQRAELEQAEGFWASFGTMLSNPRLLGSVAVEAVPQIATIALTARRVAANKFASVLDDLTAKGVGAKEAAQQAQLAASKSATYTVMGMNTALETGMASQDIRAEILTMPEAQLQSSPQYQALVQQFGDTDEGRALARQRIANDAALTAGVVTAPIAAASSLLFRGGVEGDLARSAARVAAAKATGTAVARPTVGQAVKKFGLGAGREMGEEIGQEGGSQFGGNVGAVISGADPERPLMQGVPESAGAAAAVAGVIGGATNISIPRIRSEDAPASPAAPAGTPSTPDATSPAGSPSNQAAAASTDDVDGFKLSDEEFGRTMQNPQITPVLAALYYEAGNQQELDAKGNPVQRKPGELTMQQTQIVEIARRYNPAIDQSYFENLINNNQNIVQEGFRAIEAAPAGFIQTFRNSIAEQVAKPNETALPPRSDEAPPEGNFSDPDSADAAIASAEDAGIEPGLDNQTRQDLVDKARRDFNGRIITTTETQAADDIETNLGPDAKKVYLDELNRLQSKAFAERGINGDQGGTANVSSVPSTDAGGASVESTQQAGFVGFRQTLLDNARSKGVSVNDNDYIEVPVPAEIKAIGDALGVPVYGYRYTGKSKKLQMLKGISTAAGIGINANAKASHLNVLGHEVYHELAQRDPAAAAQLTGLIQQYLSEEGKAKYATWMKTTNYDPAKFDEEMAADVLGLMFTDTQFWSEVNQQNQSLLEKVLTVVSNLISKLKAGLTRDEMYTKRGRAIQGFITDYDGVRKMLAQFVADSAKKPRATETQVNEMADIDPLDQVTQLAREGKRIEAAKLWRSADLYKQTGIPFERFYAEAVTPPPVAAATPQQVGVAALPSYQPGQRTMRYAGIGARATPPETLAQMTAVAKRLAEMGYTLYSGGAKGADSAFEEGAGKAKEIFYAKDANATTRAIAKEVHPAPSALTGYVLDLMARNTNQIFGRGLDSPVDFVLAWTPDGAETSAERTRATGGTGQAIDLANRKGVPVINLARPDWEQKLASLTGATQAAAQQSVPKEGTNVTNEGTNEEAEVRYADNEPDRNLNPEAGTRGTFVGNQKPAEVSASMLAQEEMRREETRRKAMRDAVNQGLDEEQTIFKLKRNKKNEKALAFTGITDEEVRQRYQAEVAAKRPPVEEKAPAPVPRQGQIGESTQMRTILNKYRARAETIVNRLFGKSVFEDAIARMDKQIRVLEGKKDKLESVSRSDVENIMSLFQDPRYRSVFDSQTKIPVDENGKPQMTQEFADKLINRLRGAIRKMTGKDADVRNKNIRLRIGRIQAMLGGLRTEMEQDGIEPNLIDDILLDKETGAENILKNLDSSVSPEREIELRQALRGLNITEQKTKSVDPLAKPMSVDEIVNNAKLSADPAQYVRSILNRLGFEQDVTDRVVSTIEESAEGVDMDIEGTGPETADLFGEKSVIAAQFVDALAKGDVAEAASLDTIMDEAIAAGVGRIDILQELNRRNIKVPVERIALDGRPAFNYTLKGWMDLSINQDRNPTDVREDWLSSLDSVLNALKSGPVSVDRDNTVDLETKEKFESGLTAEEKTLYSQWKQRRNDLRKRLEQRVKKEGANVYLFDSIEDAFPHALFNKYKLSDMQNPDRLDEESRRVLQYLTRGGVDTLPDLWFNDINKVLETRGDLEVDLLKTIDESEYKAYQNWRNRQIRAEFMRAKMKADLPEYKKLLQLQNDLSSEMYADFVGRIARAKQSERAAILQSAWELAEQKRAAEETGAKTNDVEAAVFEAIYEQDGSTQNVLDQPVESEEAIYDDAELGDPTLVDENGEPVSQIDEGTTADPTGNVEALVDLLRNKWTRFKTGQFSGVVTSVEVDNHLKEVTKGWKNAPPFEVVSDIDALPEPLFKYVVNRLGTQSPKGMIMPDGKVFLFAANIENLADAEFTFLHEVYGHYGLRGLLGARLDSFLENQYKLNKNVRDTADALMAEAEASGRQMTQLEATEEAISDLAAENKEPGLFSQILQAIQKFLRSVGMTNVADWMESKSQAELASVLSGVRKAVRNGQISPLNGAPDDIRFNADPMPIEVFAVNKEGRTSAYGVYNPFTHNWTVFYNPVGLDKKNFGIQVFDNYADALKLIKTQGKTIRVKDNPVRMDKMPGDFINQTVPDFKNVSGIKKWARMAQITIVSKYKPVYDVVNYLKSKGIYVDLDQYLKLYNGRIKPYFDAFRIDKIKPIADALNKIRDSNYTYTFRNNDGEEVPYGGSNLVGLYLIAKHARERNAEVRERTKEDGKVTNEKGSGIYDSEADKILKDLRQSPVFEQLERISKITQQISVDKVNYALQTGLINEYSAANMKKQYKNYVNLSGSQDPDSFDFVDQKALGGKGFNVAGQDFKYATGRATIASDVLENTLNAYLSVVVRGQKNRVMQSLMRMVNNANDPRFGVINPITSARKLDIDKLIQDKVFHAALSDTGDIQAGKDLMRDMKDKVNSGQKTPFEAATELQQRLDQAMYNGRISSKQHEALSDRLQKAIEKNMELGADGYLKEVSQLVDQNAAGAFLAKVDGKPVIIKINEGEDQGDTFGTFASALKNIGAQDKALVLDGIATANRFIGQLLTSKNLTWVPINWFRDIGTAYANLSADPNIDPKVAAKIAKYSARAYRVSINKLMDGDYTDKNGPVYRFFKRMFKTDLTDRESRYWDEYVNSGAPVFFMDRKDIKEQLDEMQRELSPSGGLKGTWEAYGKFADFVGIPSEMSVRFSAYMHLRESGMSKDEAAIYAKELTVNFEQKGSSRWISSLFMFANPAIQGNIRMLRDAVVNGKINPRFAGVMAALAALGMVSSFIARAAGAEDDEDKPNALDTIPRAKRATQVVLVPGMHFGAPLFLPYGWNVYYAFGHFMPDSLFFDTPAKTTIDRIASTAVDAFWPLGQSESSSVFGTFIKSITPTPIAPIVDIAMNESRFGGPITKENNPFVKAETSASWSNFNSSSPISTFMMRGLNSITGGNQYRSGLLDFNPDRVDYIAGALLPGPISDVGRLVNMGINVAMGKELKTVKIPLVDRFGSKDRQDNPSWDAGAYRRAITYVDTLHKEYESLDRAGQEKILKEHPGLGRAKGALGAVDKQIRNIRTALRAIENNPNTPSRDKVEARNKFEKLEQQYYAEAVSIAMKTGFKDPVLSD